MRVEDLDRPRTVPEAVRGNLEELRWLGLTWDEGPDVGGPHAPYLQSEREAHYQVALEQLQQQQRLFACYLSRKDLRELASAPHGPSASYGPEQRTLNARVRSRKQASGKVPSLRFTVSNETVSFHDLLKGPQALNVADTLGDFVVRRADGLWAYQLAVVVDDIAMEITQVVRGDDLLSSTGAQLLLYRALGATPPSYLHVPLLLDASGERMAKRKGSLTLQALRNAGVTPERIVGLLAHTLGLLPEPQEISAEMMLEHYSLTDLQRRPSTLTPKQLEWLHTR